jgi:phage tail sheath gpL-like
MAFQRVDMTTVETTAAFESYVDLNGGDARTALNAFVNYINGCIGGQYRCAFNFTTGAVKGTATITSTGAASNDETHTVCGVTFTAKTSGATGNQWNLSAVVATQAANIAAAINASSDLSGIVTATSAAGVVTVTAVAAGAIGNGLEMTESLSNVTISNFATEDTGVDGTTYTITAN